MPSAHSSPRPNLVFSLCTTGSLLLVCVYQAPLGAQQTQSLSDPAYMFEVTQKVDSLIEHKYVLPEYGAGASIRIQAQVYVWCVPHLLY